MSLDAPVHFTNIDYINIVMYAAKQLHHIRFGLVPYIQKHRVLNCASPILFVRLVLHFYIPMKSWWNTVPQDKPVIHSWDVLFFWPMGFVEEGDHVAIQTQQGECISQHQQ